MPLLRCRDIPEIANRYIDRETTVVDFAKVVAHLSACGHCRTYVRSLRITRALATDSLRSGMPPELRVRLALEPQSVRKAKRDEDPLR